MYVNNITRKSWIIVIANRSIKMKEKDKYEEIGCEFLNESECEEELEDEGTTFEEAEEKHFHDKEEGYMVGEDK